MRQRPAIAAAVTGNSRLLATYGAHGDLQAAYWPHIDFGQHIHELAHGVALGEGDTISWTHTAAWEHALKYEMNSAVLRVRSTLAEAGLQLETVEFAPPGQDGLVRRLTLTNGSGRDLDVKLALYAHLRVEESPQYNSALYLPEESALAFYRRNTWVLLAADQAPSAWQCGRPGRASDAWAQVNRLSLAGAEADAGDVNGALLYHLGRVRSGESTALTLYLSFGQNRKAAAAGLSDLRGRPQEDWQRETNDWWRGWLAGGRRADSGNEHIDRVYDRSLITLKLLSDERGGGFIAGPEVDPEYALSGGYAYCWGRDAAYVTTALDEAGHFPESEAFFLKWATAAQEESGAWLHRHYVDGTLAPSWGLLQIDEGASILYGAWRHYEATGDRQFARAFWPHMQRGAEYLLETRDRPTGLPSASIDLWEKRQGLHAYSSAAVYAGLLSAARFAEALGEEGEPFRAGAAELQAAITRNFWDAGGQRFLRTIRLAGTGPEEAGRRDLVVGDVPDISLLGLAFPFGALDPLDGRLRATASQLEEVLAVPDTGAVMRYQGDQYIGGHPWLLASLWLAIYKAATGDGLRAREMIEWTAHQATPLGLLPEQVDTATGEPTWVTPLAWSHAMFVLAVHQLAAPAAKAGSRH